MSGSSSSQSLFDCSHLFLGIHCLILKKSKKMGSCASAQKQSSGSSSWKLRASLVHSELDKNSNSMAIESIKEKPENVVQQPISSSYGYGSRVSPLNSVSSFSNHGSKEETFFDSQAWLESDCEDEFYSVGDFTPSRGSTPLYRSIPGTPLSRNMSPRVNRALFEGRSSPYYAEAKGLQRTESETASPRVDSENVVTVNSPLIKKKSKKLSELFRESIRERQVEESVHVDAYISETKSRFKTKEIKAKSLKHAQCCLPRLHSGRFSKKTMVPVPTRPIVVDV